MKADFFSLRFAVFVGCLIIMACIIDSLFSVNSSAPIRPSQTVSGRPVPEVTSPPIQTPPPSQPYTRPSAEEEAAAKAAAAKAAADKAAAERAAAERAKFLARYLNGSFTRQAGKQGVAIVVAGENGRLNPTVTTALANRLQNESLQIFPSFFTSAFIADGLFKDALTGSAELFRKLELAGSVSALVLAREEVKYATNTALENVITATLRLDVTVMPVAGQGNAVTWTFTAYGPGFTKEVARVTAEERIIKQISNDTKMSLVAIIPNN